MSKVPQTALEQMQAKLIAELDNYDDMDSLLPFITTLLPISEIKNVLRDKLQNRKENFQQIRSLYIERYFGILSILPTHILLNRIFPYLLTSKEELITLSTVCKQFNKLIFQYHLIHSINQYEVQYFTPNIADTLKTDETKIYIDYDHKNIIIAAPVYFDDRLQNDTEDNKDNEYNEEALLNDTQLNENKEITDGNNPESESKNDTDNVIKDDANTFESDDKDNDNDNDKINDADDAFLALAINDYYVSVVDELELKEGNIYTVMATSPSGWWYAVDENGNDGWVPSMYLIRVAFDHFDGLLKNYSNADNGYSECISKSKLNINLTSFPFRNMRKWHVFDSVHNVKIDEMHNILNILLNSSSNIYYLQCDNVITKGIWMNHQLCLKNCNLVQLKHNIAIDPILKLSSLLKNSLLYLEFNQISIEFNDNDMITFNNKKASLMQKNELNLDLNDSKSIQRYEQLAKIQMTHEIISYVLNECGNTLLIFAYMELENDSLSHITNDNYQSHGILKIPKRIQFVHLQNCSCFIDIGANTDALLAIVIKTNQLFTKQIKNCKQKYVTPILISNENDDKYTAYTINNENDDTDEQLIKSSFPKQTENDCINSIGYLLMKYNQKYDEKEIMMYENWWNFGAALWLKTIFENK